MATMSGTRLGGYGMVDPRAPRKGKPLRRVGKPHERRDVNLSNQLGHCHEKRNFFMEIITKWCLIFYDIVTHSMTWGGFLALSPGCPHLILGQSVAV